MAEEKKRITDLVEEASLDDSDLLLIGSNGTSALRKTMLGKLKEWILSGQQSAPDPHPVGSVYMSVLANADPEALFGGKWRKVEGAYLYLAASSDEVGKMIGSNSITLTSENIPSHSHTVPSHSHNVTVSDAAETVTNTTGAHIHGGKYDKDTAAGTGRYRFSATGKSVNKNFTTEEGSHQHTVPAHGHTAACSTAEATATGNTGTAKPVSIKPLGYAVNAWYRYE